MNDGILDSCFCTFSHIFWSCDEPLEIALATQYTDIASKNKNKNREIVEGDHTNVTLLLKHNRGYPGRR